MFGNQPLILSTISGECFEVTFKGTESAQNRDGVVYLFRIKDLTRNRGERLVLIYRFGPKSFYAADYDLRIENVRFNKIRRSFDSGLLSFDVPFEEGVYQELKLEGSDFNVSPASVAEIKQFTMNQAYWCGFRYNPQPVSPLSFDTPIDTEYLGVVPSEIQRYVWLLSEQGLLKKTRLPGSGIPTAKLIEIYESEHKAGSSAEQIFPKGTQYEGFKEIKRILAAAKSTIFIVDNYVDESLLQILEALPSRPMVQVLTAKASSDFKVAVTKFRSQYRQSIEVKLHQREIHDRAIIIDKTDFYVLGASIKNIGEKLSLINKLTDLEITRRLWSTLQTAWDSASSIL